MSHFGLDAGDLTPDEMYGREPIESDRATCTLCDGRGCVDCLGTGVEQTRADFEQYDEQADGSMDLRLVDDLGDDR